MTPRMLTYYRMPELRAKSFDYTILYDLLLPQHADQPSIDFLLNTRKSIVFDNADCGLGGHPDTERGVLIFA